MKNTGKKIIEQINKISLMDGISIAFIALVLFFIFLYSTSLMRKNLIETTQNLNIAKQKLVQNEETYKHWKAKYGSTSILKSRPNEDISYILYTFDDGDNWYAVEKDKDSKIKILGKANDVYPGILEHIAVTDKLFDDSKNNNAIRNSLRLDLRKKENQDILRKISVETIEPSSTHE